MKKIESYGNVKKIESYGNVRKTANHEFDIRLADKSTGLTEEDRKEWVDIAIKFMLSK